MHEVRLHKQFVEGSKMLTAASLGHEDYEAMIICWFGEEIDWCKERKIDVLPRIDLESWLSPGDKIKAIVRENLEWPGPDVCFIFYNRHDAMLFKLRWV